MTDRSAIPDLIEASSADVKRCVLVSPDGPDDELGEMALELLERAGTDQVEVSTGSGTVYALRSGGWSLAVIAGRFALSSLVFYDMRQALAGRL